MLTLKVKKLNFRESIAGMIGKKTPESVLIQTRFGIHTFGLKSPIDVLVLEKQNEENIYRIVQIKHSLSPNRIFFWNIKYNAILELPINAIIENHLLVFQNINLSLI